MLGGLVSRRILCCARGRRVGARLRRDRGRAIAAPTASSTAGRLHPSRTTASALGVPRPPLLIALAAAACSSRSTRAGARGARHATRIARWRTSFKLPDLGEGLTEGEVARWLVSEGQEVAEDDPLVEIQTDKATVEIPSPYAGTVLAILVAEGEVAPVGAVLVVIGAPGEARPTSTRPKRRRPGRRVRRRAPAERGAGNAARAEGSRRSSASTSRRDRHRPGRPDHGGRRAGGRRVRARPPRAAASRCAASAA